MSCPRLVWWLISIHALREEGDIIHNTESIKTRQISIHALREEGDCEPRCAAALYV